MKKNKNILHRHNTTVEITINISHTNCIFIHAKIHELFFFIITHNTDFTLVNFSIFNNYPLFYNIHQYSSIISNLER